MNSIRIVFAVSVVVAGIGSAPAVYGQEAKQPADIRMLLNQPQHRGSVDATAVPDIRDLAQPKKDEPPVAPPIRIIVEDPRCHPGEDGLGGVGGIPRRTRSR